MKFRLLLFNITLWLLFVQVDWTCATIDYENVNKQSKIIKLTSHRKSAIDKNSKQTITNDDELEFGSSISISGDYFAQSIGVSFDLDTPYTLIYDGNYAINNGWPAATSGDYFQPEKSDSFRTKNLTFEKNFGGEAHDRPLNVGGIWASDIVGGLFGDAFTSQNTAYNASFALIQSGDSLQNASTIFANTGRLGLSLNGSDDNWLVRAMKSEWNGLMTFFTGGSSLYLGIGEWEFENCNKTSMNTFNVVASTQEGTKQWWQIQFDGFEISQYTFFRPQYVRFTLSTNRIWGPQRYVEQLRNTLDARDDGHGRYIVDCSDINNAPSLSFFTSKSDIEITPDRYIIDDRNASGNCYLAVEPFSAADNVHHWAIGTRFLASWCLTIDFINESVLLQPVIGDPSSV